MRGNNLIDLVGVYLFNWNIPLLNIKGGSDRDLKYFGVGYGLGDFLRNFFFFFF